MTQESRKILKEILKNEVAPLLIGIRNDIRATGVKENKSGPVIQMIQNGKELPEFKMKDGETPVKGKDYFTEKEIKSFLKATTPKKGKDYFTKTEIRAITKAVKPVLNKDYFVEAGYTPIKGKDYFTQDEIKEFINTVTPIKGVHYFDGKAGPKGEKGKDGTEISAHDIRTKLEGLTGRDRLKIKAIHNLEETLTSIKKSIGAASATAGGLVSAGMENITGLIQQGTNISITGNGTETNPYVINSTASGGTWGSITGTLSSQTDLQSALNAKENTANKGIANGYVPLDSSAKIATTYLPAVILGALNYQGTYDASSGIYPTSPSKGYYWVISVQGTLGGVLYKVNDWLTYDGTNWDKVDNSQTVVSVFGRTGAVVATAGDYDGLYEYVLTFSTGFTRSINTITNNLSTGISGGQSVIGGTGSGDSLTLQSTTNATRGNVKIDTTSGGFNFRDYLTNISAMYPGSNVTAGSDNFILASFGSTSMFYGAGGASSLHMYVGGGNRTRLTSTNYAIGVNTVVGGINDTASSKLEVRTNALGVTQTTSSGVALTNTTAAALAAQQISPALRWSGRGWATTGSTSQAVDFRSYVLPTQGAAQPTGELMFESAINGGSYQRSVSIVDPTVAAGGDSFRVYGNGTQGTMRIYAGQASSFNQLGIGVTTTESRLDGVSNIISLATNSSPRLAVFPTTGFVSIAANANSASSRLEVQTNALGTTQTTSSGIALTNSTAAANNAQQISPALRFTGYAWKSNATAASQAVDMRNYLLPVQGTTAPTSKLIWESSINGGAYSEVMSITSAGLLSIGGNLTSASSGFIINSTGNTTLSSSSVTNVTANGSASTFAVSNTGLTSLTGQSLTGSSTIGLLEMTQTWNTSGSPTAIRLNITNTASGASAKLLDLKIDGTSMFNVDTSGNATISGKVNGLFQLKGYTVATLPASPAQGDTAFVTDALTPTFLSIVVGGGAIVTPVFYNGTNWVAI